jgi:hypothetical protein
MSESNKELVIRTTVTVTSRVPFDEEHYPGMTLEQAVEYEQGTSGEDRWETVVADMQNAEDPNSNMEVSVEIVDKDTGEHQVFKTETVGEYARRVSGARDDGQYGQYGQ